MESVPGAAIATGAQASSVAITRRDNAATGTVALQSYPVALTSFLIQDLDYGDAAAVPIHGDARDSFDSPLRKIRDLCPRRSR